MKRWTALGLAVLLVLPVVARADTAKVLGDLVKKYSGALAAVHYTADLETGSREVEGQAVCITPDGVFLTTALDPRMPVDSLKNFQLILPGVNGKKIKAKLLGVDPWTGLGFVKATEPQTWQVVQFSASSTLQLGQQVSSIGLMAGDPARPIYVGTAFVSAILRVPGDLVFLTGGRLTGTCSPVFTDDGRAIGIVGRQLPLGYQAQVLTQRGPAPMAMRLQSSQETAFFTPVEEFVHVLREPPSDGKVSRLPWMGVNKFEPVGTELAEILKLDKPAVKVDEVIPNQPAAQAGLADRDIIVEVNGKPIEEMATPELSVRNFVRELMRMKTGEKLVLKVLSGRQTKDITITLGDMPMRPNEAKRYFNRAIGLLVREKVMLDEFLDKDEDAKVPGLLVVGMAQGSAAVAAGLQGGDVITNVNNQPVKTVQVFQQIVEKSLATSGTAPINFLVRRGTQAQVITVTPGT